MRFARFKSRRLTNDNIKVYGHYLFNAFGGFMTEDVAIITLYFASRGKKKVPLFAFDRGASDAFYHRMQVDLRELEVDSEDMTSAVVTDKAWLGWTQIDVSEAAPSRAEEAAP